LTAIKALLQYDDYIKEDDPLLNELSQYLPWPEMAVTAYNVFNYMLGPDVSLVAFLQDEMGKWWTPKMHSLEGGLSALPNAFANEGEMEQHITYNRTVNKVEYLSTKRGKKVVKVSGTFTSSGQPFTVEGRSIILTVPLHVLRGIVIMNGRRRGRPFPREFHQAIEDISYEPSTKIMLQYKQQFWNTGSKPDTDITGGFSKTNLAIGQLHYPTDDAPGAAKKGILMVYTWKAEALLWGALSEDQAIRNAVEQIDQVHPGIDTKALFEVGRRQAWTSDPTTLGAFAMLRPGDYISLMFLMQNSWKNVYFAGEAVSFANGWIQGALESGLRAAYQLFRDDQKKVRPRPDRPCSSSSSSSSDSC
jgi:monoamine oxidase